VRHGFLQRWSVIVLLLGRLVLGQSAHAMPHDHEAHAEPVVKEQSAEPCHEAASGHESAPSQASSASSATPSSVPDTASDVGADGSARVAAADEDCCETQDCDCACVSVSALAASVPFMKSLLIDPHQAAPLAPALLQDRVSLLFRPPK
jgi:hypothetical protein